MRSLLSLAVLLTVATLCSAVEKVPEAKWTVVAASTEWTVKKVDAPPTRNVGLMGGQQVSEATPASSGKNIMIEGRWYKPTASGSYTECVECNAQKAEQIPVLPRPVTPPTPIAAPITSGPCPCGTGCPCAAPQQMPQYAPQFTNYTQQPQASFGGVCGVRGACGVGGGCGLFGGGRKGPIRNLLSLIFHCGG